MTKVGPRGVMRFLGGKGGLEGVAWGFGLADGQVVRDLGAFGRVVNVSKVVGTFFGAAPFFGSRCRGARRKQDERSACVGLVAGGCRSITRVARNAIAQWRGRWRRRADFASTQDCRSMFGESLRG